MAVFILRRLLSLVPIWLGVTFLTFAILRFVPGDPVVLMLGPRATPERVAVLREQLGLDQPLPIQYAQYVLRAVRGDLGQSMRGATSVREEILLRIPSTLELAVAGLALAVVVGLGVGTLAAATQGRRMDRLLTILAAAGLSVPLFWLAPLLILIFGVYLKWVPITSSGWQALILPGLCIAIAPAAILARLTRASILAASQQDYVRTAWAKGLASQHVYGRHVLPNALLPIVTVIGLLASALITGTVFIEVIFSRPGLGRFAVNAVLNRDLPQIQGIVLFTALVYGLLNLVVDMLYVVLDPRLRTR